MRNLRPRTLTAVASLTAFAGTAVLTTALATSATATEQSADGTVDASIVWVDVAHPSWVVVPWESGETTTYSTQVYSICTGFFVSDEGDIATAGHCIETNGQQEDAAISNVLRQLSAEGYGVDGLDATVLDWTVTFGDPTAQVGQPSGVPGGILSGEDALVAQIIDHQGFMRGDNALLRVADLEGTTPLAIAEGTPRVGDTVTAIGFPGSVSDVSDVQRQRPSYKFGTVSSRQYSSHGVPSTEIDAAVSGGMSGGPTINEAGEVIGINSFGIHGESQPFNFVTDTDTLRSFLIRNGVDPVTADTSTTRPDDEQGASERGGSDQGTTDQGTTEQGAGEELAGEGRADDTTDERRPASDTALATVEELLSRSRVAVGDQDGGPGVWPWAIAGGALVLTGGVLVGRTVARGGTRDRTSA